MVEKFHHCFDLVQSVFNQTFRQFVVLKGSKILVEIPSLSGIPRGILEDLGRLVLKFLGQHARGHPSEVFRYISSPPPPKRLK